eukprot:217121-Amphidinium_carterae.2
MSHTEQRVVQVTGGQGDDPFGPHAMTCIVPCHSFTEDHWQQGWWHLPRKFLLGCCKEATRVEITKTEPSKKASDWDSQETILDPLLCMSAPVLQKLPSRQQHRSGNAKLNAYLMLPSHPPVGPAKGIHALPNFANGPP